MDKSLTKMMNRIRKRYAEGAEDFSEMSKLYADEKRYYLQQLFECEGSFD